MMRLSWVLQQRPKSGYYHCVRVFQVSRSLSIPRGPGGQFIQLDEVSLDKQLISGVVAFSCRHVKIHVMVYINMQIQSPSSRAPACRDLAAKMSRCSFSLDKNPNWYQETIILRKRSSVLKCDVRGD